MFKGASGGPLGTRAQSFACVDILGMNGGVVEDFDEGAWKFLDLQLSAGVGRQDQVFELGLAMHVGAEENGDAEEDGFKNIVPADMGDKASPYDRDIGDLVALIEESHGVNKKQFFIAHGGESGAWDSPPFHELKDFIESFGVPWNEKNFKVGNFFPNQGNDGEEPVLFFCMGGTDDENAVSGSNP